MSDDTHEHSEELARLRARTVVLRRELVRTRWALAVVAVLALPTIVWAVGVTLGTAVAIVVNFWWIAAPIVVGLVVGAVVATRRSATRRERLASWRADAGRTA